MKKKDFEVEEFEELDEVEEFDELDDEVIDDEEFDEEEEEEVKPAKKAAKKASKKAAPKAGKKKGKGGKVAIIVVAVILVIAIAAFGTLYGLGMLTPAEAVDASAAYTKTIGANKPTVAGATAVTSSMTAYEMMEAAVSNYYAADYAANICQVGGVNTKVGPVSVAQAVLSAKVRQGKSTDSKAKYFCYSKSAGIANMWEEYYTVGDGKVVYRSSKSPKKAKDENGRTRVVSGAWNAQKNYDNFAAFKEATSTDFTKIWSYDVNPKSVTKESAQSKPVYDKAVGCYYFTISLDINNAEAFADYIEVMKYQLSGNMGMDVTSLVFSKLDLEFSVWDNGQIRYLYIHEAYAMNLSKVPVIGKLNGMVIENDCMNEFSFDAAEGIPYDMGDEAGTIKKIVGNDCFKFQ